MPVKVSFRGICLFVIKDGRLSEVLLPESETTQPREHKTPGFHVDGTKARKHYAGIFIPGELNHRKVKGLDLTIGTQRATEGPRTGLSTLPKLDDDELVVDRNQPHTSVTLSGGKVSTKKAKKPGRKARDFAFGGKPGREDHVDVTYTTPVTVTIEGDTDPIVLQPDKNPTLYIFNFDLEFPTATQLEEGHGSDDGIVILDHDFKWLFLLAAPPGNDPNKLERWAGGVLPCPTSVLPKSGGASTKTISGSTCYPGTIKD